MSIKSKLDFVNFKNLDEETLKLVWKWRTSPDIRSKMVDQRVFSIEEHLEFCSKLKDKNDVLFVLVKFNDIPIGVLTYKDIDTVKHSCNSGCYFVNAPKNMTFIVLKLMRLYLYEKGIYVYHTVVLKNNIKALMFNILKCGNKIVKEDELYYYVESDFSKVNETDSKKETAKAYGLLHANEVNFNI